ncbi:App1 family protein [Nocardioides sp.]|uniref:App1 family protein n=1 Tax=Nocardioides sp. TaxID=35761 RepID=UPI0037831A41
MGRKQRLLVGAEHAWDGLRLRRRSRRPLRFFRIETYGGHGGPGGVVVRGRVLDNPPPSEAVAGEGVGAAVRRSLGQFVTVELPDVPLRVRIGDATVETSSDGDGYFRAELHPTQPLDTPWQRGTVELASAYRGVSEPATTAFAVRVPAPGARFGIVSDVDDTIIETGVQRVGEMLLQTFAGSELTRTAFPGAPELYRDLAGPDNPVFYVSSSPWNLHAFLHGFLRHRDFPLGPLLLRDLVGTREGRERKHDRIEEVLRLHPDLDFVLIGDSGERDPEIYADIVREHPGRVLAVYIREVRLDPGDGRVEQVTDAWSEDVPFVLAADSDAVRRHAASIGLL